MIFPKSNCDESTALFRKIFPDLEILAGLRRLPATASCCHHRVATLRAMSFTFPGSTIGNFEPDEAVGVFASHREYLRRRRRAAHRRRSSRRTDKCSKPLITISAGVTAEFNLNLLERANRELGADFDLRSMAASRDLQFQRRPHRDVSDQRDRSVRASRRAQVSFPAAEKIITEYSYKYTPEEFATLAGKAGLNLFECGLTTRVCLAFSISLCLSAESSGD